MASVKLQSCIRLANSSSPSCAPHAARKFLGASLRAWRKPAAAASRSPLAAALPRLHSSRPAPAARPERKALLAWLAKYLLRQISLWIGR